jgi:hypothetical protein
LTGCCPQEKFDKKVVGVFVHLSAAKSNNTK